MRLDTLLIEFVSQDCSFPAYFYTQPMATGPGFYDNLTPQSWQDGSAATWTLQDPHQQSKLEFSYWNYRMARLTHFLGSLRLPGQLNVYCLALRQMCEKGCLARTNVASSGFCTACVEIKRFSWCKTSFIRLRF